MSICQVPEYLRLTSLPTYLECEDEHEEILDLGKIKACLHVAFDY